MPTVTKCSKNYINCRKHPARKGTPKDLEEKTRQLDIRIANQQIKSLETALTKGDLAENEQSRIVKELHKTEDTLYMLQNTPTPDFYRDGTKISTRAKNKARKDRLNYELEVSNQVEKEQYYSEPLKEPFNQFQTAIITYLLAEGDFFQQDSRGWGDTRGYPDYHAAEHFNTCGVFKIDEYEESTTWSEYDTFNHEDFVGIKMVMSCNCGEQFKTSAYAETDPGKLFQTLLSHFIIPKK